MQKIVGRVKEKGVLTQIIQSKKAEFLAIYGRRRVGKTFLIKNFFADESCLFFYCSGIKDGKLKDQLEEFSKQIGETFYKGAAIMPRTRWKDAFEDLTKAIEQTTPKTVVLFFDELPWMATPRSGLLQALDYYWNRYWSHNERIKLIVCGSSASWIIEKIINNKGGLYNRVTRTISLDPFSLDETEAFLSNIGVHLNQKQILDIYMVFGGIPHYLNLVQKGLSATQIIEANCFQKGGALIKEFERLFESLFKDADHYIKLVRTIGKFPNGIGQSKLIKESGASDGGRVKQRLKELEEAGFILEFIPYGHQEKGVYYKIIDEFTLFYLRWIEPSLKTILKQDASSGYWLAKAKSPHWRSWAGLAFESVCYKHLAQIRKALHISPDAEVGSWRYAPRKEDNKGTQIDLLFDRKDGVITICEIKYNEQPFSIDKDYAQNLLNKLKTYQVQTRTNKQMFVVMIVVNGLKPSMYSEEIIQSVITIKDLFVKI